MLEQQNIQHEMICLLQRIDQQSRSEGCRTIEDLTYLSSKFYTPSDAKKDTEVDRRSSSNDTVEPWLAVPGYNIDDKHADASIVGDGSSGQVLYKEENRIKSLAYERQEEGKTSE